MRSAIGRRKLHSLHKETHLRAAQVKIRPPGELLTMKGPATYRIIVQGALDPSYVERLGGRSISERRAGDGETETVLVGRLLDQAALSGILNELYALHLPVVSADCLESG